MDKDELLPCPFCGGEAAFGMSQYNRPLPDVWWNDGSEIFEAHSVNCVSCSATNSGNFAHGYQTKALAAAAWNRRYSTDLDPIDTSVGGVE